MVASVFIDGQAGRTGLRIRDLLRVRRDLDVLEIDNQQRKDPAARCSNAPMSRGGAESEPDAWSSRGRRPAGVNHAGGSPDGSLLVQTHDDLFCFPIDFRQRGYGFNSLAQ